MSKPLIGHWAFIIGLIVALLAGLTDFAQSGPILVVLGLIVGFLNVTEKESTGFLVATVALMLVGVSGLQIGAFEGATAVVGSILQQLVSFVAAAALVVAIKQVLRGAAHG